MTTALHVLAGALLPVLPWAWLRHDVRARASAWLVLDGAPVVALFCALLAATMRPLLAGGLVAAIGMFLVVAQRAKRATLREPLVFSDGGLLWQVVAFPRFYLPFVPPVVAWGGVGAGVALALALLVMEPAVGLDGGARLALLGLAVALGAVLLRPCWLLRGATGAHRTASAPPGDDPVQDAARFGPLAAFALHARIAAGERGWRRAAHPPSAATLPAGTAAPHIVVLQLESFCDPRRFGLAQALPEWDSLAAGAASRGLLAVPGFGANTMRTEFAVLTGLRGAALGLDRLNPYFRFALAPVASLAWACRGAGYATVCLHPFHARFFGRNRVMPALGFERFEAEPAFADAPRRRGLVTDGAIGARIVREIEAAQGPLLIFAITVAAHGPWRGPDPAAAWAADIAQTDAMLGAVARAARMSTRGVVIAAYGDHRPSLGAMRAGTDTDYLVWRSDCPGPGTRRDIDAPALHGVLRDAAFGVPPG